MPRSQYQIQAEIRRVFARHWVDLERIHFGVYRDMLRVSGELHQTTAEGASEGELSLVDVLHDELRRVPDVRHVVFDLGNWVRDAEGSWKPGRAELSVSESDAAGEASNGGQVA